MRPLMITIKDEPGYLFEGEYPRSVAFVPQNCVTLESDGSFKIDKLVYAKTRWGTRNMRFNATEVSGTRLFPNERKPVTKLDTPGLSEFLDHLRRGYGTGFAQQATIS